MTKSLDDYILAVEHLPTPPVVIVQLIALFRQPHPDVDEVVTLLRHDPSLTAEVLRRCNSAFFGGEEATVDIFDAVMRMGFYEVYQSSVAIFSQRIMSIGAPVGCIPADEFWRHSATTAVLCGLLAKEVGESEATAFTAGLLHDTGKMVLALAEGPRYAALMREVGESGRVLEDAEKASFGFGHGALGARLLERWSLPAEISIPAVRHHDMAWPEPFGRLSVIVSLADILAHQLERGPEGSLPSRDATAAMEILQIQSDQLSALRPRAQEEIAKMNKLLQSQPEK